VSGSSDEKIGGCECERRIVVVVVVVVVEVA